MPTPGDAASLPLATLGERGLIALIRRRFPSPPDQLVVGIGDDAAVSRPVRGALQVLTTDALVEGVHFDLGFCSPADVGYKALAVNISDIAAMGGTARLALLSLVLPTRLTVGDVEGLLDGFAVLAGAAGVGLAGGNITSSPGPLVVDVTVIGSVRPRRVLTRAGGRPGDALYVTGSAGAAVTGLEWLRTGQDPENAEPGMAAAIARYRRPEPRHRLGAIVGRTRAASACMDLSDGLADAVTQLAEASGTGARLEAARLPIHEAAVAWFTSGGRDPVRSALQGGDDYELLFAVPPRRRRAFAAAIAQARGVPVTCIGELTPSGEVVLARDGRSEGLPAGYTHF